MENLKGEIRRVLGEDAKQGKGRTIPSLCEELGVSDDFILASIIGELESTGDVEMVDFKTVYREDGGAILLARYTRKAN